MLSLIPHFNYANTRVSFFIKILYYFDFSGFKHEHQRHDRDQYVTFSPKIPGSNVCENSQYYKFGPTAQSNQRQYTQYDYCSLLHYPTKTRVPTGHDVCQMKILKNVDCWIKGKHVTKVGLFMGLSDGDIEGINKAYGCRGKV